MFMMCIVWHITFTALNATLLYIGECDLGKI